MAWQGKLKPGKRNYTENQILFGRIEYTGYQMFWNDLIYTEY
jgi:hypothetical protein